MAKTKSKSSSKKSSSNGSSKTDQFREEQQQTAKSQNQTSENAVPEQRPIASQQLDDSVQSETYKKLREEGSLQEEPMPKSAYDKANSDSHLKKAEKDERAPSVSVGSRIVVTEGPYEGSYAVVNELKYADTEAERTAAAGTPESRFAEVESVIARTRGGRHALLDLTPDKFRLANEGELGNRGEA